MLRKGVKIIVMRLSVTQNFYERFDTKNAKQNTR